MDRETADSLIRWWESEFTAEEQQHINETYRPGEGDFLRSVFRSVSVVTGTWDPAHKISYAAPWFRLEANRTIAYRLLTKAEELLSQTGDVLNSHFHYQHAAKIYYRWRQIDSFALDKAVAACEQQISLSTRAAHEFRSQDRFGFLPSHHGFKQLSIIKEKAGETEEAIRLCERAQSEGWSGDWEKRSLRLKKSLA